MADPSDAVVQVAGDDLSKVYDVAPPVTQVSDADQGGDCPSGVGRSVYHA